MNRVGIYLRVSTEEQARIQEGSLVSQRRRLEEFVENQNRREPSWGSIVEVYCDEAKSAKDMNRPEFQRMISDIQMGRINLVLATELSRLSRSLKDFCELWEFFKTHKVKMITLRDNFDTTTAAGELMLFNMVGFAQFERKQTSERLTANFKSRAQRGLWNGGQVPLGFDRNPTNPGTLVPNETESNHVRILFKTFLDTGSLRQTCLTLSKMGIKTKSYVNRSGKAVGGNHFTVQSLHHLLTNATFIGVREMNKKRGDLTQVPATWPAIVDRETFFAVQEKLEKNKAQYKPNDWKSYPYPLTGLLVCGDCGKTLCGASAHGKTQRHHYYDHQRTLKGDGASHKPNCRIQRVKAEKIEELVLSSLKRVLSEPSRLQTALEAFNRGGDSQRPVLAKRLKGLEQEIRENRSKVVNLVNRIAELPLGVPATPFYDRMTELNAKVAADESAKLELESQLRRSEGFSAKGSDVEARVHRVVKSLEDTPKEKQRDVVANTLHFVELHPTKLKLGVALADSVAMAPTGTGGNVIDLLARRKRGLEKENPLTAGSYTFKVGGVDGTRTRGLPRDRRTL